jgi:hypothetical protein
MKVLICGDRNWTDKQRIKEELLEVLADRKNLFAGSSPISIVIIHGGARGADTLAGEVARELGMRVAVYKAEWEKFGKAAGVLRNLEMLNDGKPDFVLAFHSDISKSKGTANMIKISEKRGIPVKLITMDYYRLGGK